MNGFKKCPNGHYYQDNLQQCPYCETTNSTCVGVTTSCTQNYGERVFYQDANVVVTQSRYIANGKTYILRNISSVYSYTIKKKRILPIIISIFGLILLCSRDTILGGIIVILIAVLWFILLKDDHSVRINSNSGELNTITSKNKDYIQTIVKAMNEAIIYGNN